MKTFTLACLTAAISASIAGCSSDEPLRTVQYYEQNSSERQSMLSSCEKQYGIMLSGAPQNCHNARTAKFNSYVGGNSKNPE